MRNVMSDLEGVRGKYYRKLAFRLSANRPLPTVMSGRAAFLSHRSVAMEIAPISHLLISES